MTTSGQSVQVLSSPPKSTHPLDPLSPAEIENAVAILRAERELGERIRFESVELNEPSKDSILSRNGREPAGREAFIILLDNDTGATYEAVVSLSEGSVRSWEHIPGVQPRLMLDEFFHCENAVKDSPEFQEALRRRGIDDPSMVMVDSWPAGNYGVAEEEGMRLSFARSWLKASPNDNGYARPIEGVIAVVDLNEMKVVRVEDHGIVPMPPNDGNYAAEFVKDFRTDLKPLDIIQPDGPSFRVDGNLVSWQKWSFRVGYTRREGLVLHGVGYEDQGRTRPIIYRASLAELVVPYGDPEEKNYRKNAFDVGEAGIGSLANSLTLGCDCLGQIYYFDAVLNNSRGEPVVIPNAVCLHEEDFGILWKHTDWRTGQVEVRRSRPSRYLLHRHRGQLRVRLLLAFLPGRQHRVPGEADRDRQQHGRGPRRHTQVRLHDRPAARRPRPPALLRHAPRHEHRRRDQLRLRSQHLAPNPSGPTTPRATPSTRKRPCWRPSPRRSAPLTRWPDATGWSPTPR